MTNKLIDDEEESTLIVTEGMLREKIYTIRGQKVMLDFDLAKIYGYTTKAFNQQVRNNSNRFDEDFMFRLTRNEVDDFVRSNFLTSQNGTLFSGQSGGSRYLPNAFTEQGVYMLMTVLKGELAIKQSKALIRTFRAMKDYILENNGLLKQREQLESLSIALENTRHITKVEDELFRVDKRLVAIEGDMRKMLTRNDLSPLLLDFNEAIQQEEFVFMDKEFTKASEQYVKIYESARENIYILDNYVSIKTLRHLQCVRKGIKMMMISKYRNGVVKNAIDGVVARLMENKKLVLT